MSSIAIFPCIFTPASEVAEALARTHDLRVYRDQQLLEDTSRLYGTSLDRLNGALYGRTSVFNKFTLEREKHLNQLKSVLVEKIVQPQGYMFFGYMTSLISPQISHIFKALIADNRQSRIEAALAAGLSERSAKKQIHDEDLKAFNLTDFLYKKEAFDSSLFDLVVPVEGRSADTLTGVISSYFQRTSLLRTEQSEQAAVDMAVQAEVERKLLAAGHKMNVSVSGSKATLGVEKSVLNFDRLVNELNNLVLDGVAAITEVQVEKSIHYNDSIYRRQRFDLPSKVLFVDDEREFVETISERLISRDVGTYGVFNGDEALSLLEEDCPDVMVLDLKMPGMSGVQVLREAKKVAPDVEVIILTGHGSQQDMLDCMELGAFSYMNKPVDIAELSATIKEAHKKAASHQQS
ncbi:response regulator [Desulfosediminicola sp.]|uniref:response regulator n=1 Tax=Desulfosediminicola sp. TaxID=2886825 RepID=UPI003AF27200